MSEQQDKITSDIRVVHKSLGVLLNVLDLQKEPMKNLTHLRGLKLLADVLRPMVKVTIEQAEDELTRQLHAQFFIEMQGVNRLKSSQEENK